MNPCAISNIVGSFCQTDQFAPETLSAKQMNFAEEASFFASFFKNTPVKPMPDSNLIMVLNKRWLERKKRKISKKEKLIGTHFGKKYQHSPYDELKEY